MASLTLVEHPLAQRVWDVKGARFIEAVEAQRRIVAADVALLGETHDNPVHHELQLRLLRAMVDAGRKPTLALEQLDIEHQPAIDAFLARPDANAAALAEAAKAPSGWRWSFYEPMVALAIERRLPVIAINLSRPRAREIAAGGLDVLGKGEAARLAVEAAWTDERNRALRRVLVEAHCGDDSPMIDRMVVMQRARDALMADRIAAVAPPVVAIIGRGHAQADLGVPLYLRSRFPERRVVSLAFVEVEEGALRPADYSDASPGAHDFVWFTPRAVREDPCKDLAGVQPAPK